MAKDLTNASVTQQDSFGDFASITIPESERKSGINIFLTTAGWIICMSTIFTGGALVAGLTFRDALIATVIGMLILALFAAPLAAIGAKYGVSTTMLTRHSFGRYGAMIFGLIVVILLGIGWYAWQAAFFGMTMSQMFPNTFLVNPKVGALIGGILMMLTALYGYKGIAALSFVAVPLIFLLSIFGSVAGITQSGGWGVLLSQTAPGDAFSLYTGITIVVGNAAMGAVVLSDITRYAKSSKVGAGAAALGYMFGGIFCVASGAAMAVAANIPGIGSTPDVPKVMVALGLGVGALLVMTLAQWTTNTANLYSASLGMVNVVPMKQKTQVLIMGILATALALIGIFEYFVPFLNFLGTYIPPIAGVMLADYWVYHRLILKKEYTFGKTTLYSGLNWVAVISAIAGGSLTKVINFGIPCMNGVVGAFLIYLILMLFFNAIKVPCTIGSYVEKETGF